MAAIGLKNIYVGLKDLAGNTLKGEQGLSESYVFAIDTDKNNMNLGSKTANITGLAGAISKIMGNNVPVDISHAKSAPSVAIDSNMINPTAKQKMLGRVKKNGGWVDGKEQAEVGLIIESQSPITFNSIYFQFGRGIMTETSQNVQTNTDTAETREDDNLTFTALNYDKFDNNAFKYSFADDTDFDLQAMFDEVFPGNSYDAATGKAKTTTGADSGHQSGNSHQGN